MRVGLYLDLRNPRAWRRPWAEHHAHALELVVEAERLGADSVWLTEHHFFDDGYLPQPLTFAAAIAARTRRLRLGTAVLLAALRPAIQIAEEAAVVDILSGGRLELGFGAGYVRREYEAYGADLDRRYTTTDQRVREVRALLDEDGVTPPPIQRPFPLWLGYQGPKGAARAGRLGVGLLSLDRALLAPYRSGLAEGGHDAADARMAGLVGLVVADDPEAARERLLPHIAHQLNTYREAAASTFGKTPRPITVEQIREGKLPPGVIPPIDVVGADEAIGRLRALADGIPAIEAYFWASVAGMPDDLVQRHVELLCTVVRPAVADA
jgi:alkanesulfonate monooxygenase SsuD/methylene tetrahydromethanopterin reductase-like flavin-dependent oxidoreductase (luciferase family)